LRSIRTGEHEQLVNRMMGVSTRDAIKDCLFVIIISDHIYNIAGETIFP